MNDFPSSGAQLVPMVFGCGILVFGNVLHHFGHAAVLVAGYALVIRSTVMLTVLCIALFVSWLAAWRLEVGSLWRASLVSAFLLSAGGVALLRLLEWGYL